MNTEEQNKIIKQCIAVYSCCLSEFILSLRKQKHYRAARILEQYTVNDINDVDDVDDKLRDLFKYSKRRPNAVAPWCYYPMLGFKLYIHSMKIQANPMLSEEYKKLDGGSFMGCFASFCMRFADFCEERLHTAVHCQDLKDTVNRIFREISYPEID